MEFLGTLLRYQLLAAKHKAREAARKSRLKIFVVFFLSGGLWLLFFGVLLRVFYFIQHLEAFKAPFLEYVFSLFFLVLGIFLIFSNVVISFGTLFTSRETRYLAATPVPAETVFSFKMAEGLSFSSWAFLVLGLPPMLAYCVADRLPWYFLLFVGLFYAVFVFIPAALGTLLALLLTRFVPKRRMGVLAGLALALVLLGAVVSYRVAAQKLSWVQSDVWLPEVLNTIRFARNPFLPSYWIAQGILEAGQGRIGETFFYFGVMAANALLFVVIAVCAASRLYRSAFSRAQSSARVHTYSSTVAPRLLAGLFRPFGAQYPVLLEKDIKTFCRDPLQWSQFAIFFGILTLYILNLRSFRYDYTTTFYKHIISFLNLTAISLTLATLTTRFVFPLLSLEGRHFWILGLMPVKRRVLLNTKFLYAFFGALAITEFLTIASAVSLRLDAAQTSFHAYTMAMLCLGLSGIAVGMGAMFPDFGETNPSKIVSGFGGTLTLVLSMLFVITIITGESVFYYHLFVKNVYGTYRGGRMVFTALMLASGAVAMVACALPMYLGRKALERMEF